MSLGFLTESALLPSKAKPIKVDSKSVLDLKAVLYQREKELEHTRASGEGIRRGKRRAPEKKSIFDKKNKGVDERGIADEELNDDERAKKKRYVSVLKQKAKLYDKISKGEIALNDKDKCLVNFGRKTNHKDHEYTGKDSTLATANDKPGYVNIKDEFGRSRSVQKGSKEHDEWINRENEASQEPLDSNIFPRDGTSSTSSQVPGGSHVVSQWEKTLKKNEREFLSEIQEETVNAKKLLEEKKRRKALRLKRVRDRQNKAAEEENKEASSEAANVFLSGLFSEIDSNKKSST